MTAALNDETLYLKPARRYCEDNAGYAADKGIGASRVRLAMQSATSICRSAAPTNPPPLGGLLELASSGDPENNKPSRRSSAPVPIEREDLPYKVEIWNEGGASVEQVLAVTANASIGYAAYYAATREFPDRRITLRHKNSVVARWNGPKH